MRLSTRVRLEVDLAILRALVAGERRGDVLARLRRPGCRHTAPEIIAALTGTWRDEHLFVLAQSLDLFDFLRRHGHD